MAQENLGNLLKQSARKFPHRGALIFGRKKISYKELNDEADAIAAGLIELGIKKQDGVAILMNNCPEFVVSYYAILKAGAVVVPINFMFKMEEAKFILQDSQAKCLITSYAYLDMAEELRLRLDCLEHIITPTITEGYNVNNFDKIKRRNSTKLNNLSVDSSDLAVILYTSGTTGNPKGAMLTHSNLISNARDSSRAIKVSNKDTFICILPLFHSFAATVCMNLPLIFGAKIVIMKSVRPFKRVIRAIRKNRVSVFVGIPSIYTILKDMRLPKILYSPLIKLFNPIKICISGAAALPVETFNKFEKKFRIPLLEGYGLTEASPVVSLNPVRGIRKAGSIGKALSNNIKMKIVDDNGRELKTDEIGELAVKGPNVMQGYFRQEVATNETIKDNWLLTGDMAKIDSNGYAYIVGRKKDMVNVRGLNVYPREIEEILYQNHKVKEAAVIGVPDKHKGEVPKAFIVLKEKEEASAHEITEYLKDRLASYKMPKHIEFKDSLPKNTTGKVLKRLLRQEQ